ncbi:hypothetical protein [Couchioplanes azureus]|uniref:hypothetical protein n=1 Tax=Couchioplanes caeruleus TaxID=56438 RepID=UPI0019B0A625|nr:hypothetical protein [Couchioplanes caeruleus]GGQ72558.1 hypothetical protein GCM10010166_48140 [Couchioplanes caeruleus subsp. azureus]
MRAIYVETVIDAPLAAIWQATQDPAVHCRWDARFGRIEPVPGTTPAQFRYATAILPGLEIDGFGIHAGQRDRPDGTRTSALRFGSADRRSLIAAGRGYWRYLPGPHGVRFLTGYTYTPRWGLLGRMIDAVFRPLFGWATAWSFDRLRLWLERGIPPERALRHAWGQVAVRAAAVAIVAALGAGAAAVVLTSLVLLVLPPGRNTPAARRCRRQPLDRLAARAPSLLETL